jgi:hypothetical protein
MQAAGGICDPSRAGEDSGASPCSISSFSVHLHGMLIVGSQISGEK